MTTGTKGQTRPVCTRTGDDSSDITRAACLTPRDGSEDNPQLLRMRGNIKYRTDGVDSAPSYARHLVWLLAPDNGNQQHSMAETSPRETKVPLINELHCCEEHRDAWVLSATALRGAEAVGAE